MNKNINDLKIKSINDLVIPKQFQGYVQLMELLRNNQHDDSSINELIKLIDNYSLRPDFIEYLLISMLHPFPHKKSSLYEILEILHKKKIIKGESWKQFIFESFENDRIIQSIVWDKIDEFLTEIEKETIDINQEIGDKAFGLYTLIDFSCKYGSENCFTLLKCKGASISDKTSIYAVEGGNKNIILSLYNDYHFKITDKHLTTALKYHHNDIFDWLLETQGFIGDLNVTECFLYLNIKGLLFLIENGFDVNSQYIFQKLFIFKILYSSLSFVYY